MTSSQNLNLGHFEGPGGWFLKTLAPGFEADRVPEFFDRVAKDQLLQVAGPGNSIQTPVETLAQR